MPLPTVTFCHAFSAVPVNASVTGSPSGAMKASLVGQTPTARMSQRRLPPKTVLPTRYTRCIALLASEPALFTTAPVPATPAPEM